MSSENGRQRILATDDRPEILRMIDRALGDRYDCEYAGDVAEARAKLAHDHFELALCDIQMPGESGLTLAQEIVETHGSTAVVLVTGEDDPRIAETALEFGAHGYLVKPFWPGQLLITAMNAIHARTLEGTLRDHNQDLSTQLQVLLDRAPVAIYMKDRERRFVLANPVAHEISGLAPGQMIGLHSAEIMSPEAERVVARTDGMILADGSTIELEESLDIGDADRSFLTVKFPFVDGEGRIAGVYGISTDISDKKQAEALREELAEAQDRAIEELRASRQETVDRLTTAIERRDAETGEHVNRLAAIAAFLGFRCGLDHEQASLLRAAAPMHDVGKISIPDEILLKPGALTAEERTVMERHTIIGHEILAGSDSDLLRMAATIALTHHERWDGGGYPQGLVGDEIPPEGRIVAVADVFDALLSDRVYRPAFSREEAVEKIREGRGTHFDPAIADVLLANLDEALSVRG